MNVVIGNFGNETIALLNWCLKNHREDVYLLTVNTGWQSENWQERVVQGVKFAEQNQIKVVTLNPTMSFVDMVKHRGEFPTPSFLWCADSLKKVPILNWLEEYDPSGAAIILLPYLQATSKPAISLKLDVAREHYDDREVEYPLLTMSEAECQQWVADAGFDWLTSRSQECAPCINSSVQEFRQMPLETIAKLAALEIEIGNTLCKNSQGLPINIDDYLRETDSVDSVSGFELSCSDYFSCGK